MTSRILGLVRQLKWSDFRELEQPAPAPGASADAAETRVNVTSSNFTLLPVPHSKPPAFRLVDQMSVSITLDAAKSWRASWVKSKSETDQALLLLHEQGHYNLGALFGRDFFEGCMQLKSRTYTGKLAFDSDLNALDSAFLSKIQPVQDLYDNQTDHSLNQAKQDSWNKMISDAFTQKAPLIDVLRKAGVFLRP